MELRQRQIMSGELSACIFAGDGRTLGVMPDGSVLSARHFCRQELGTIGCEDDIGDWRDIVAIAAGSSFTAGLRQDGTVALAGNNCNIKREEVEGWRDIVQIAAGSQQLYGLKSNGTVVASGLYVQKPLGRTFKGAIFVEGWRDIVSIAAGIGFVIGLSEDGMPVGSGQNDMHQCDFGGGAWRGIVAVAAGHECTLGLRADGTAVTTGYFIRDEVSRWRDVVAVAAGAEAYAVKANGTVLATEHYRKGEAEQIRRWKKIVAVHASLWHTVGLREDGTVTEVVEVDNGASPVGSWKLFDDCEAEWRRRCGQPWHARLDSVRANIQARRKLEADRAEQARRARIADAERIRREKIVALNAQKAGLLDELTELENLKGLRGLFNGKQKEALKARILEIEREIQRQKSM